MTEIQIGRTKVNVPSSWEEVTIRQVIDYETARTSNLNDKAKEARMMASILKVSPNTIGSGTKEQVDQLREMLQWLSEPMKDLEPKEVLEHNGKRYRLEKGIEQAKYQQYIDLETMILAKKENPWEAVPYVMAVYLLEEGEIPKRHWWDRFIPFGKSRKVNQSPKPYDSDEMLKRAIEFESMQAVEGLAVASFFTQTEHAYKTCTTAFTVTFTSALARQVLMFRHGQTRTLSMQRCTIWLKRMFSKFLLWRMRRQGEYFNSYTSPPSLKKRRPKTTKVNNAIKSY